MNEHTRDLPAPPFSFPTRGPIVGVIDGSDAAPGEVGEFLTAVAEVNYAAGPSTSGPFQIPLINMPPGDWDCTISASFTTLIDSAWFILNPQPQGVSNEMYGLMGLFGGGSGGAGTPPADLETVILIGQSARASFALTTLMNFQVEVYQGTSAGLAGVMALRIECRRRR